MENGFLAQINGMKSSTRTFLIIALISVFLKFDVSVIIFGLAAVKSISSILATVYIMVGLIILIVAYLKDKEMKEMGENIDKAEAKKEEAGISRVCVYAISIIVIGFIFLA